MKTQFQQNGLFLQTDYLSQTECDRLLKQIADYQGSHDVPHVFRKAASRSLDYWVIAGSAIQESLPDIWSLAEKVRLFTEELSGERLALLSNLDVAVNINITRKGGQYRWHYDRNPFTSILYLNRVSGGEIDLYPRYRWRVPFSGLQKVLDRFLQTNVIRTLSRKGITISPEPGQLMMMEGDRCLHSVRPVLDSNERMNIVIAFEIVGKQSRQNPELDKYLYQSQDYLSSDPNYK